MAKIIAVAGKGGTGKTTVSALTVKYLLEKGIKPVMAVDADPNSCFGESLGIDVEKNTIGDMREEFLIKRSSIPPGMSKETYLEMMFNKTIIESTDFDLLAMGRQEGPGCYCSINNILRGYSEEMEKTYKVMIYDNEAGMEHLSRRTVHKVDYLWLVTDHSARALRACKRIYELIQGLGLDIKEQFLVINRAPDTIADAFKKEIDEMGVPIAGTIPPDELLGQFDLEQKSLLELPTDAPSYAAAKKIFDETMKF